MRVLIAGCGYVGIPLGAELKRKGHEVFGLNRTSARKDEMEQAGITPLQGDIRSREDLAKLPLPFDWMVNCVSAGGGGPREYREIYRDGMCNLVDWLRSTPIKKFIYTSSTGVYGQDDGSQVKEESPSIPGSETGQILVETENLLLEAFQSHRFPAVILRAAGIYGPDRGYWFRQYLKNEAFIEGRGERFINMIHLDDLVQIIITALHAGHPGQIYNAVDNEPVAQVNLLRWLSETLGKDMPPFVKESDQTRRQRIATNKRVLNRKLKMELGYQLKYPTFRQGFTAEIQRMEQLGAIELA